MRAKYLLTTLMLIAGLVSLPGVFGTWPFIGQPANTVTATPQVTMNPFAVVIGDAGGNIPDMGATPDSFVVNADWNQEPIASATGTGNLCGSTVAPNCVTYKYIDQIRNFCKTPQTQQILIDAGLPATTAPNGAETWFQHFYPSNPTPTPATTPFRNVAADPDLTDPPPCDQYYALPYPTTLPAGIPSPVSRYPFMMNIHDAGFKTELQATAWTTSTPNNYPQSQTATSGPYNIYEDNSSVLGKFVTGAGGNFLPLATEYSCGYNLGQTCRIDAVGTGPYHVSVDWDTALGEFANSACPMPLCLKVTFNGASVGGNISLICNVWNGTSDCHDGLYTGYIDNTFEKAIAKADTANTSGNITDWDDESPIYDHVTLKWGNPALLAAVLNTWINFQQDSANAGRTITDLEPGWGSQGTGKHGDTSVDVRTMSIAMEWLAPDYSGTKSSNDRIIPRRLPIGLTTTEAPSFFELFLVPFAPEETEAPYVMNTSTITTLGTGCLNGVANAQGDTHGIIDILQACGSDDGGTYVLQYKQLWFNHTNFGPAAVIVNMSSTTTQIPASGWFKKDSWTTYNFQLSLAGSEMESVAQGNIGGGVATFTTCTNVTYCAAGGNTMVLNTAAWSSSSPGTVPPHSALILLATN